MEMIHSRSYTYIIKNVYSTLRGLDKIVTDDRILERASSVTQGYDDFIQSVTNMMVAPCGNLPQRDIPQDSMIAVVKRKLIEQLQMSTSLKEFGFMFLLLAVLLLVNLNSWKVQQKLSPLLQMRINTSPSPKTFNKWKSGDDPEMKQIMKEEEEWTLKAFDNAVNEEKRWADYLFRDGSMIGLNDKLLQQYVEWIANRRLKAIGLKPHMILQQATTLCPGRSTGSPPRVFRWHHRRQR